MELREAIEEVREHRRGYSQQALTTILNAVADGTLIPADAVFQVRGGYDVSAIQTYNKENDRWDYPVPLTEALEIRSADDVRREALEEAAKVIEWTYNNVASDGKLTWAHDEIRALIDTPQQTAEELAKDAEEHGCKVVPAVLRGEFQPKGGDDA